MRISDWSSDVCSSDLKRARLLVAAQQGASEMNPPKIAVAIATAGRRDTVTGVIERLALQTHRPDFIAICPARPDDVDRDSIAAAAPGVLYAEGPVGLCAQVGSATSELQSLMRISYAVFCLKKKNKY